MKAIVKYGILVAALAILLQTLSNSLALSATLLLWYFLGGKRTLYLIYHTLDRDGRYVLFVTRTAADLSSSPEPWVLHWVCTLSSTAVT